MKRPVRRAGWLAGRGGGSTHWHFPLCWSRVGGSRQPGGLPWNPRYFFHIGGCTNATGRWERRELQGCPSLGRCIGCLWGGNSQCLFPPPPPPPSAEASKLETSCLPNPCQQPGCCHCCLLYISSVWFGWLRAAGSIPVILRGLVPVPHPSSVNTVYIEDTLALQPQGRKGCGRN